MSQRGSKRAAVGRSEEVGSSKRRKAEPEDLQWQPRPINDLKISTIYNRNAPEAPAELFRKDLISAMKLPDSEPLAVDEYWIITDPWKQEWERGVQVPVNPDSLPEPTVKEISHPPPPLGQEFNLPKNKYIKLHRDANFSSDRHQLSNAVARAEAACGYDLDATDASWLRIVNGERARAGHPSITEDQLEKVIEELELRCWDKIQAIIKSEEGLGIEYDENVICDVCRSPDSEDGNEMVFCDSCNICVHQACYGITTIPQGQWLCRPCCDGVRPVCVLCPNLGGAMKCTPSGHKWAHVSCVLWIPEVSIGCAEKMEPITKISAIPPSRWSLICVLCRERTGACIQCSVRTCKTAYHVTCAFKHGLEMRAIIEDENADDGVKLRSYCQKHSVKKDKNSGSGSDEEEVKRKRRKDMTSEEKSQARAIRLHEIEAEFDRHVSMKDISSHLLDVDQEAIQYIYNYWKMKRRAGHNRPLLPPKTDDSNMLSHRQEQADLDKMKSFVQLRQDLERVRNLCYMVSRREKLSRSFFRFSQQTFHKQVAVLSAGSALHDSDISAVIDANHGPSIYDRLYSHPGAIDHGGDLDTLLARIAGVDSEDEKKKEINGVLKPNKTDNPYKRLYFNGSSRRSGSLYGSELSSEDSGSEIRNRNEQKYRKPVYSTTDEDEKPAVIVKKKISPHSRASTESVCRPSDKKKIRLVPTSRNKIDSSSDNDCKPTIKKDLFSPKSHTLTQMEKEMGAKPLSGSDSDELIPIRSSKKVKVSMDIYSDSENSDNPKREEINEDKSSNTANDSQHPFKTKAAVKEFIPLQKGEKGIKTLKRGRKPSVREKLPDSDEEVKDKENLKVIKNKEYPSDLIVPQRQAAKKASENMRSNTSLKCFDSGVDAKGPTLGEESKLKSKPCKSKEKPKELKDTTAKEFSKKESKVSGLNDIFEFEKEGEKDGQDVLAYVPQRKAAKKAAEHIKSGMGKIPGGDTACEEANKRKESESNKTDLIKKSPKKEDDKKLKTPAKYSLTISSPSSSSSSSSNSSTEAEDEGGIGTPKKTAEKRTSVKSLFSPPSARASMDLPFLDKVSRPLSSSSHSSDSETPKESTKIPSRSPSPRRSRKKSETGQPPKASVAPRKAPDKKLKTSNRRSSYGVQSSPAEREEPYGASSNAPTNATRFRPRSSASGSGDLSDRQDSRTRKQSQSDSVRPNLTQRSSKSKEISKPSSKLSPSERKDDKKVKAEKTMFDKSLKNDKSDNNFSVGSEQPKQFAWNDHSKEKLIHQNTEKVLDVTEGYNKAYLSSKRDKNRDEESTIKSIKNVTKQEPIVATSHKKSSDLIPNYKDKNLLRNEKFSQCYTISNLKQSSPQNTSQKKMYSPINLPHLIDPDDQYEVKKQIFSEPLSHVENVIESDNEKYNLKFPKSQSFYNSQGVSSPKTPVDTENKMSEPCEGQIPKIDEVPKENIYTGDIHIHHKEKIRPFEVSSELLGSHSEIKTLKSSMTNVVPYPGRSIFSPQPTSKDNACSDLFDFGNDILAVDETVNDGFGIPHENEEISKAPPLTFSFGSDILFKDSKEDRGVQETLNLVEKLRLTLTKINPVSNQCEYSETELPADQKIVPKYSTSEDYGSNEKSLIKNENLLQDNKSGLETEVTVEKCNFDAKPEKQSDQIEHSENESNDTDKPSETNELRIDTDWVPPDQEYDDDSQKVDEHASEVSNVVNFEQDKRENREFSEHIEADIPSKGSNLHPGSNDDTATTGDDLPLRIDESRERSIPMSENIDDHNDSTQHQANSYESHSQPPECTPIPSPYNINQHSKWSERELIPTRRSSVSSSSSETSIASSKTEEVNQSKTVENIGHLPPHRSILQMGYNEVPPYHSSCSVEPLSFNPFSSEASSFIGGPPSLFTTPNMTSQLPITSPGVALFPTTLNMQFTANQNSIMQKNREESLTFPAPCAATFTSSSHNMALTAAMVAPPTPVQHADNSPPHEIDNDNASPKTYHIEDSSSTNPDGYPLSNSNQQSVCKSLTSSESSPVHGKKSSPKATRLSSRYTPQQGKSPMKSPEKSPKQFDLNLKNALSRRGSNKSNRNQRGRGRPRGKGPQHSQQFSQMDIGFLASTIHNKLVGTVYDLDFDEDIANDNAGEIKSLRERRRSLESSERKSENSYRESSHSPKFASPAHQSNSKRQVYASDARDTRPDVPTSTESTSPVPGCSTGDPTSQSFRTMVQPVLPGPVDMRTYSGFDPPPVADPDVFNNHLLGAFASGTADQQLAEIDEEMEKELHVALLASSTKATGEEANSASQAESDEQPSEEPLPPVQNIVITPKVSLSDSRNQLKVKIKGPFLDANYSSSTTPVVPPAIIPIIEPAVPLTGPPNAVNSASSSMITGTSNLRRMRKKELLRQYWTQDMNMDDPGCGSGIGQPAPPVPAPMNRTVITIPKAVASMTSIPTREDYKAVVDANMQKKRRKGPLSRESKHLEVYSNDDDYFSDERRSPSPLPHLIFPNLFMNRRRGRAPKQNIRPSPNRTPLAPKLKIKIGNNFISTSQPEPIEETRSEFRPPKKRLTSIPKPSVEDLRRESMKFRKKVMADFQEDEKEKKRRTKSEKRKKKKDKHSTPAIHVVNKRSDNATKLIIRIGRKKDNDESDATLDEKHSASSSDKKLPQLRISANAKAVNAQTVDPFEYDPTAPDPLAIESPSSFEHPQSTSTLLKIRTSKVTPIRLKIARSAEGSGYVMRDSPETTVDRTPKGVVVLDSSSQENINCPPLPVSKNCEVR